MHLQNINKSRQNKINQIICHLFGTCGGTWGKRVRDKSAIGSYQPSEFDKS